MKHDCRLRSLEVFEDEEGYLFVKDQCNMPFGREHFSRVEYCPVCGMKGNKSHINHLTMYRRTDVKEDTLPVAQLEHMHKIIMENFLNSCEILVKEDLDDHSFQFCLDTIQNTLRYVTARRKENNAK